MPIYEYRCEQCGRRAQVLHRSFKDTAVPNCPRCGQNRWKRLVSRVAVMKSEEARMEAMADPSGWGDVDENDPKSVARFMRKMGQEMGEELGPEFDEVVERLEAGEDPESIEASVPGLGGGADGGADGDFL
jgi:putative FmdB family regulatory protein